MEEGGAARAAVGVVTAEADEVAIGAVDAVAIVTEDNYQEVQVTDFA